MNVTIWSEEFRALCKPESNEAFGKIVNYVDAYASKYLADNNAYLTREINRLLKDVEIARAENKGLKDTIRAQPVEPVRAKESIWYMNDNHTFLRLTDDVDASLALIKEKSWSRGQTHGLLASKNGTRRDHVHARGDWADFERRVREWYASGTVP